MASRVDIKLFGPVSVSVDQAARPVAISGATRALFQYLVCHADRSARRELLIDLFWDKIRFDRRRSALNSAIWRIRKQILPIDGMDLDASTESVAIHLSDNVTRDMDCLQSVVARFGGHGATERASDSDAVALANALDNSAEPFLEGLDQDWAVIEREKMSEIRLRGLNLLMRVLAERRRYDDALACGRQVLAVDPFREATFREVLCLCVMSGQRVRALRMFEEFRRSLDAELGIAPMAETLALIDHIRSDNWNGSNSISLSDHRPKAEARRHLCERLNRIEDDRMALYRSMSVA